MASQRVNISNSDNNINSKTDNLFKVHTGRCTDINLLCIQTSN